MLAIWMNFLPHPLIFSHERFCYCSFRTAKLYYYYENDTFSLTSGERCGSNGCAHHANFNVFMLFELACVSTGGEFLRGRKKSTFDRDSSHARIPEYRLQRQPWECRLGIPIPVSHSYTYGSRIDIHSEA